jgi:hypothetical protein
MAAANSVALDRSFEKIILQRRTQPEVTRDFCLDQQSVFMPKWFQQEAER